MSVPTLDSEPTVTTPQSSAVWSVGATDRAWNAFTNLVVAALGVFFGALLAGFLGLLMNWIPISC